MTPIGHLSVSYISGRSIRGISLPAIMIGGIVPDFDFLFFFFEWFNQVHRVISHNIFFIILVSFAASFVAKAGAKKAVGFSLFLGASLHLFIDSCMDINPTNGTGIALLWPLVDTSFSPFNLFHDSMNGPGWTEPLKMLRLMIPGLLYELPFYVLAFILLWKEKIIFQD